MLANAFIPTYSQYNCMFHDSPSFNRKLQPFWLFNSYTKSQRDALFPKFILLKNSTCFGQIYCPSSVVSTLYTQQNVFVTLVMLTVC
jgi:hypothetical protein